MARFSEGCKAIRQKLSEFQKMSRGEQKVSMVETPIIRTSFERIATDYQDC